MNEKMVNYKGIGRAIGITFICCFAASIISGTALLESRVWHQSLSENLQNVAQNELIIMINIFGELITGVTIIALAALFYHLFSGKYKVLAMVGFGFWITEAITLMFSKVFTFGLWDLSQKFVDGGSPVDSSYLLLGDVLFNAGIYGYVIHMVFFCLGGIIWYTLLYKEGLLPKLISVWSLIGIGFISIDTLLEVYDPSLTQIWLLIPYAPFELFIGIWLTVKGFRSSNIKQVINNKESIGVN